MSYNNDCSGCWSVCYKNNCGKMSCFGDVNGDDIDMKIALIRQCTTILL